MPSNSKDYMKKYYKQKKAHILERMKEPVLCDICHTNITRSNFKKHLQSIKHKKVVEVVEKKNITLEELSNEINELKETMLNMRHSKYETLLCKFIDSVKQLDSEKGLDCDATEASDSR